MERLYEVTGVISYDFKFNIIITNGVVTSCVGAGERLFLISATAGDDYRCDAGDAIPDGGAHLNFITREGIWDQSQLEYAKRLVMFADAVQ